MSPKKEHISVLADAFQEKFNLLIVDDYSVMCNAIVDLFSSPLFKTSHASSANEARELIINNNSWHSWILDIAMEEEESGLHLLGEFPNFPFVIMLSGMRSMNVASRAMQLGAFKVFDKEPSLLPILHIDVCSLSAIAWILNGRGTKYFSLYLLLAQMDITSTEVWANQACLTVRQLERICSLHSHLTPRFIPPLFTTLKFLLQLDSSLVSSQSIIDSFTPNFPIEQHMEFVVKNLDIILK